MTTEFVSITWVISIKEFFNLHIQMLFLKIQSHTTKKGEVLKSHITLEHGSGGRASSEFLEKLILRHLDNEFLRPLDDSAELPLPKEGRLAFTTDSYVIDPIFFPGGDIGSLSVHGTVNDLVAQGAIPLYISLGLIVEEGLQLDILEALIRSIKKASMESGVQVVTGDTKVVKKGQADKIYINTSGIGVIPEGINVAISNPSSGDLIIINGHIGDHGAAVILARENLSGNYSISSDSAPLRPLLEVIYRAGLGPYLKALKDPTRGGLATVLNEIARASNRGILLDEGTIPIKEEVNYLCELLGLDPLYLANEGKLIMVVKKEKAEEALALVKSTPLGKYASIIGEVTEEPKGKVLLKTRVGGKRLLPILSGMQLPRIC